MRKLSLLTGLLAMALFGLAVARADLLPGGGGVYEGQPCPPMSNTNPDCRSPGKKCNYGADPGYCARPTGITQCTCVKALN